MQLEGILSSENGKDDEKGILLYKENFVLLAIKVFYFNIQ